MSSEQNAPGQTPPMNTNPHPHVTFHFPVVFVANMASTEVPGGIPPEAVENMFATFLRAMPFPFMPGAATNGQFEPIPQGPPKKHATESAVDRLCRIDVGTLSEEDRKCHICMQDYPRSGPRSPYVEDVIEDDVSPSLEMRLTGENTEDVPIVKEGEYPLQMPCGHVFGSCCLKEWLYQSPTCPLCRVEIESYTDEPQAGSFEGFMPWIPQPTQTQNATQNSTPRQDHEMHVDSEQGQESSNGATPPQVPPQIPSVAFQFIFTAPPPNPPSAPTNTPAPTAAPTPPISRQSSRPLRHHPYSRPTTPAPPLIPSLPTVIDRPDLFCAQRQSGLCDHDVTDDSLLRLECGHAFHRDCLEGSMIVEGYSNFNEERRCPRCRRWMSILN